MAERTSYFITGANRGIGKGLVSHFLQKPNTTVIAGVRDPSHATAKELTTLPKADRSTLILVKIDSVDSASPAAAVATLQNDHGITSLDLVFANAGIAKSGGPVRDTTVENINEHILVNTIAPVLLFQATAPLLRASSTKVPVFVVTSSIIGSMEAQEMLKAFPNAHSPYGGSKAAVNWFVRRLHFEEPWLTSFVFHPGLVETDLALGVGGDRERLRQFGAITVETSVKGMAEVLEQVTREHSGTFKNYDGKALPW